MDIIDDIINRLKNEGNEQESATPEAKVPNGWGHQQYDGKIRELLKDRQIDINNHKDSYMVIQEFLKENIDGFRLKKPEVTDPVDRSNDDLKNSN